MKPPFHLHLVGFGIVAVGELPGHQQLGPHNISVCGFHFRVQLGARLERRFPGTVESLHLGARALRPLVGHRPLTVREVPGTRFLQRNESSFGQETVSTFDFGDSPFATLRGGLSQ